MERLSSIDIHTLLPQQPPFVMVGELVECTGTCAVSQTVIDADNIFVEDGVMSAEGILENIAQTCAARLGYYNVYVIEGGKVEIGFIGALKGIEIKRLPSVGERIRTTVTIQKELLGVTLASAMVETPVGTVAEGEIKIALIDDGA